MIGKIFYGNEWHFCEFDKNELHIFIDKTIMPFEFPICTTECNIGYSIAEFKDGKIRIFDLSGEVEELNSEYYSCKYLKPNYLECNRYVIQHNCKIQKINSVTFKNGVLRQILALSKIPCKKIKYGDRNIDIEFLTSTSVKYAMSDSPIGKMMSNFPTQEPEFALKAKFDSLDINELNDIVNNLYNIIRFLSKDFNAPVGSVELESDIGTFEYFNNDICYKDYYFKRFCYADNLKEILESLIQNIFNKRYDMKFLSLIDKNKLTEEDYWVLAHSVEQNISDEDSTINAKYWFEEEKLEKELRNAIKKAINEFERQNKKIDNNRKSFMLNILKMSPFKKKVTHVLKTYNSFMYGYRKDLCLADSKMKEYVDQFAYARNTIHGEKEYDADKASAVASRLVIGLYIEILNDCNASYACVFNAL